MPFKRQAGFTLIELMVVIAVLAALLAMAWPNFEVSLRTNRVATATNEMIASLAMARSEAIRSTRGAGVCSSDDGASCGGTWADGWLVWGDTNGNEALDDGETVLRYSRGGETMTADGPDDPVTFDSRGRRRAAADQVLSLEPQSCEGQELRRTLTINASGQVRTVKGACS